jgi:hypothetical protein
MNSDGCPLRGGNKEKGTTGFGLAVGKKVAYYFVRLPLFYITDTGTQIIFLYYYA